MKKGMQPWEVAFVRAMLGLNVFQSQPPEWSAGGLWTWVEITYPA